MALNLETLQIQFEIRDNTGNKIKELQKKLQQIKATEVQIDTEEAERAIDELREQLEDATGEVQVNADTRQARQEIRSLAGAASAIDAGEVAIGANTDAFDTTLRGLANAADGVDAGDASIGGDATDFRDELAGVDGAADGTDAGDANIGGDATGFRTELAGVAGAAEGTDAGDADIGGDASGFRTELNSTVGAADSIDGGDVGIGGDATGFNTVVAGVQSSVSSLPDGDVDISGNATGFNTVADGVRTSVSSLPNGHVTISGNATDAVNDIESVESAIDALDTDPEITPDIDLTNVESGIKKFTKLMVGAGLLKFGASAFEFGFEAVNAAYAADAANNQIENLAGDYGIERIGDFTKEMNQKYGFNEAGLAEMTKNFVGVFVGSGMAVDEALEKGIEMARYAIDYASALDMTPGEIGEKFMSILGGSSDVAKAIGMYRWDENMVQRSVDEMLGIDKTREQLEKASADLDLLKKNPNATEKRIAEVTAEKEALEKELAAKEKDKAENISLYKAKAFHQYMKYNADEVMGFTGDWERTADEFGNQMTMIEEKWKTIEQSIGTTLLPVANTIVSAINDVLDAVNAIINPEDTTSFAARLEGFFGTNEMSKEEREAMVNGIVGPINDVSNGLKTATDELNKQVNNHEAAAKNLAEMIQKYYITGNPVDKETVDAAIDTYYVTGIKTIDQSQESLLDMFMAFGGTTEEWMAASDGVVANIQAYYKGIKDEFKTQSEELRKVINDAIADGVIDMTEQAAIREQQLKTSQSMMQATMIDTSANMQMRLDEFEKAGDYSAKSIERFNNDLLASMEVSREELKAEYGIMREAVYKVAAYNQAWYERDAEGFKAATGLEKPMTAQEMLAQTDAEYERKMKEMDMLAANTMARALYGNISSAMVSYDKSNQPWVMGWDAKDYISEYFEKVGTGIFEILPHVKTLQEAKANGEVLSEEAEGILKMYSLLDEYGYTDWGAISGKFHWRISNATTPDEFMQIVRETFGAEFEIPTVTPGEMDMGAGVAGEGASGGWGVFTDMANILANFPDTITVESHVYVDGYELGKATEEATITYDKSTGQ